MTGLPGPVCLLLLSIFRSTRRAVFCLSIKSLSLDNPPETYNRRDINLRPEDSDHSAPRSVRSADKEVVAHMLRSPCASFDQSVFLFFFRQLNEEAALAVDEPIFAE